MDNKNDKIFRARMCIINSKNALDIFKKKEKLIEFKDLNEEDMNSENVFENESYSNEISKIKSKYFKDHQVDCLTTEEKFTLKEVLYPIFPEFFEGKTKDDLQIKNIVQMSDFLNFFNFSFKNENSPYYDSKKIEKILRKVCLRFILSNSKKDEELKFLSTHLFLAILGEFEEIINYKYLFKRSILSGFTKYSLYSGHDRNIQDVLLNIIDPNYIKYLYHKAFVNDDAFDFLRAPFSSFLIFELHYDENTFNFFIKILYNGEEIIENLRSVDGQKLIYVKDKGFNYQHIKKLLVSRIDMRIKDIDC